MFKIKAISKEQAFYAIKNGEFEQNVLSSKENVAVILTQHWCPQWEMMQYWLNSLDEKMNIDIYLLVYDLEDFFNDFLNFKETVWKNAFVPYIRYYCSGKLIKQTNAVSRDAFLSAFGIN